MKLLILLLLLPISAFAEGNEPFKPFMPYGVKLPTPEPKPKVVVEPKAKSTAPFLIGDFVEATTGKCSSSYRFYVNKKYIMTIEPTETKDRTKIIVLDMGDSADWKNMFICYPIKQVLNSDLTKR